ncbi:hypothetical protein AAF712_008039 [Marasmius tenuissimus]|uniref:Uncharacterized protein n=1 Tax=Marasmius tenuissimus TaxID=585030 RepID=A0ABR2ZV61_9AGAR
MVNIVVDMTLRKEVPKLDENHTLNVYHILKPASTRVFRGLLSVSSSSCIEYSVGRFMYNISDILTAMIMSVALLHNASHGPSICALRLLWRIPGVIEGATGSSLPVPFRAVAFSEEPVGGT